MPSSTVKMHTSLLGSLLILLPTTFINYNPNNALNFQSMYGTYVIQWSLCPSGYLVQCLLRKTPQLIHIFQLYWDKVARISITTFFVIFVVKVRVFCPPHKTSLLTKCVINPHMLFQKQTPTYINDHTTPLTESHFSCFRESFAPVCYIVVDIMLLSQLLKLM